MPLDRKQTSAPSLPVVSDSVQHLDANEILPYRSYISPEHKSGYPVKHDALGCGNVHHLRLPQGYEVVPPNHKDETDRKSTRLNSSHVKISYAVFCLKKKKKTPQTHSHH